MLLSKYSFEEYVDGSLVPVCITPVSTVWADIFFLMTISVFFLLPLVILIILYAIIARNLIMSDTKMKIRLSKPELGVKARKQVILMLGAVVLSFFICLLPFRMLTLWIIMVPEETYKRLDMETYYTLLYFCRVMWYLNSAINPILYNLMSSKFRKGFLRLFCLQHKRKLPKPRAATATTSSYLNSSQHRRSSAKITMSLDDLRIPSSYREFPAGGGGSSSTTSGGGSSGDVNWFSLQSPLLRHDLRRLAVKNNFLVKKVSLDDTVVYGRRANLEYRKQISFDDRLLNGGRAKIYRLKYIDGSAATAGGDTPTEDVLQVFVPLLNKKPKMPPENSANQ